MTRSDYFRPVSGGISGLCVEPDDNPLSTVVCEDLAYSALNRSCNATVKAEVTRVLTLTNQSRASLL